MLHGEETFDGPYRDVIVNDVESLRSSPLHLEPQQWCQVLHSAVERLTRALTLRAAWRAIAMSTRSTISSAFAMRPGNRCSLWISCWRPAATGE